MSATSRPTNLGVSTRVHRSRFSVRSSTRKANEPMREEMNDQNTNSPRETAVLIQNEGPEPIKERKIPEVVAEAGSYPELIAISLGLFLNPPPKSQCTVFCSVFCTRDSFLINVSHLVLPERRPSSKSCTSVCLTRGLVQLSSRWSSSRDLKASRGSLSHSMASPATAFHSSVTDVVRI